MKTMTVSTPISTIVPCAGILLLMKYRAYGSVTFQKPTSSQIEAGNVSRKRVLLDTIRHRQGWITIRLLWTEDMRF